ncbi:hypothetical protein VNO78_17833 [Psophocarpus tetragonolobus]|uniref:Uncharacterized protein n=1 Tax=Psophocarpus tetragonolobus TaxID=3891 RepID=A0AAN9SHQ6_PSOTE
MVSFGCPKREEKDKERQREGGVLCLSLLNFSKKITFRRKLGENFDGGNELELELGRGVAVGEKREIEKGRMGQSEQCWPKGIMGIQIGLMEIRGIIMGLPSRVSKMMDMSLELLGGEEQEFRCELGPAIPISSWVMSGMA